MFISSTKRGCARLSFSVLILLASAIAQTDADITQISSGPYRIAGTVINAKSSAPLAQCRITIADAKRRNHMLSIVTGADGRFAFSVPAGKYSLAGAKHGFIPSAYKQHEQFSTAIVTGAGIDTDNLSLTLPPNAVLSGRVLDEYGDPVRDAHVNIYREMHSRGTSETRRFRTVTTDDLGRYEVGMMPEGNYFVSAQAAPWYAVHPSTNVNDPGGRDPHVDASLDVAYPTTFYGDVTDANDATPIPVRGGDRLEAEIHLTPVPALHLLIKMPEDKDHQPHFPILQMPTFAETDRVNVNIQSGSPGLYEITGIPPGKYLVRSEGPEGQMQKEAVEMNLSNSGEFQESPGRPMSVIVAKVELDNVASLPVNLQIGLLDSKNQFAGSALVNAQGEAQLSEIIPGTYNVVAFSSAKQYAVVQIGSENRVTRGHALTVPAGASLAVKLSVVMGSATIEGFAKRSGKAAPGAMIVLVPKDAEANLDRFRRDQSDLDGSFSLQNVIPGAYTIIAIEDGWSLDWANPAAINHYLAHGRAIEVKAATKNIQTTDDVEVQLK